MYAYQNYKEQSVYTMTKGEMLILLYDEIIKRLTRAEYAIKSTDMVTFEQSIQRTSEIVRYLNDTLDRQYEISRELARMYEFFQFQLARISASRKPESIEELKNLVSDLRDTFKEANKIARI
ncbi:MAG: flagellar export chaperone FliS [Peptostreptococcaceae bacterium]|nr:flagellar export chaperone FliS [Peptostreptococcaceae bacterium]